MTMVPSCYARNTFVAAPAVAAYVGRLGSRIGLGNLGPNWGGHASHWRASGTPRQIVVGNGSTQGGTGLERRMGRGSK
jgi:hypothetical protein